MSKQRFWFSFILHASIFALFILLVDRVSFLELDLWSMLSIAVFSAVYYALLWFDLYSQPYHHYLRNSFKTVMRALGVAGIILLGLEFAGLFVRGGFYLRNVGTDLLLVACYWLFHLLSYLWIVELARLGFFTKNVMLVGDYDHRMPVERLFQNLAGTKNFLGQLSYGDGAWRYRASLDEAALPIQKDLEAFLFSHRVNELILCADDALPSQELSHCAAWCRENSIGYYLIPDVSRLPKTYPWGARFSDVPQIERYAPNRDSLVMVSCKRLFDILASAGALILLSPVFLIVSFLIWREDGFPIFYVSTRVGIHGRPIRFIKFRSMVKDAEKRKAELLALNERPDGPLFKLSNDPRITRIGAFLRRTSLDEIPQFWNVLRGDMSIIGPRPHLPSEVAEYSDLDNLRLECIPGIACLPQIRGRDTLGFREWVDLDLEYRKHWSFQYDFTIMFQVAKVVLKPFINKGDGAA